MYLAINILGLLVFLAVGWVFSNNRKDIKWKSVGCMVVLNLIIAFLLTSFEAGRAVVKAAADGFAWIVNISYKALISLLRTGLGPMALTRPRSISSLRRCCLFS